MGYYGDDRDGGERWRDRDHRNWNRDRDNGRMSEARGDYGRGGYPGGGGEDRGFIDRAGDEVRSWFGDDEAQRRRERDQRRWEQEHRMSGGRDNDAGPGTLGGGGFGTGWGNQAAESWNRERPGARGWPGGSGRSEGYEQAQDGGRTYASGEREGWFTDSVGGERGRRPGGGGYGAGSPREASSSRSGADAGGLHDPHYSQWRRRQIEDLDRDYDEFRREHQSRFEAEFADWRSRRQGQRQALGKATEEMEVVGSDGSHVGKVDKVRGDRIILAKNDPAAGGAHHSVPCSWVETIEDKVTLNRTAQQAMDEWRNEERSRALFERDREGEEGPHILNRSFPGTYDDGKS